MQTAFSSLVNDYSYYLPLSTYSCNYLTRKALLDPVPIFLCNDFIGNILLLRHGDRNPSTNMVS